MPAHAAVRVDDDLAAREPSVAVRTADDEAAGGVDVDLGGLVDELGGEHLLDDEGAHGLDELLVLDLGGVLRRHDDGGGADGHVVLVLDGDLGLAVGAQPVDLLGLADLGQLLRQLVGEADGGGQEVGRLVGGVAEHEALIAGALAPWRPWPSVTPWEMSGLRLRTLS